MVAANHVYNVAKPDGLTIGLVSPGISPYVLPPGTPKERVEILQEAMRKSFKDPDFHKEFKKLTGDVPTPLMPETMEKYVREIPRSPEIIALFHKIAGAGPLPAR